MDNGLVSLSLSAPFARTLSDQVAKQLRQAILQGRLKPGQRIVEHEIAQAMAISRGPVRDALRILQNERLVVQYPHRGAFVAWLTLRDAEEIYSLREALEVLALRNALVNATDEQLADLDRIVDEMKAEAGREGGESGVTELDLDFHQTLCRISGHSRVLAAWTALRSQVRLLMLTHQILHGADFSERAIEWHRRLVSAMRQRNGQGTEAALREHLAASFEATSKLIRESNLNPPADF